MSDLRPGKLGWKNGSVFGNHRRVFVIDEVQHLKLDCKRYLLGMLENLSERVIVIGTTTSLTWANNVDGLLSRWRCFRFTQVDRRKIVKLLKWIATDKGLEVPDGFRFDSYLGGKYIVTPDWKNVRDCVDQLQSAFWHYKQIRAKG